MLCIILRLVIWARLVSSMKTGSVARVIWSSGDALVVGFDLDRGPLDGVDVGAGSLITLLF
jgi:hypothetical protein